MLGVPAFRVTGWGRRTNPIYFLLVTLAFGELLVAGRHRARPITGGIHRPGRDPVPDLGFGIAINSGNYYYLVFVILVV